LPAPARVEHESVTTARKTGGSADEAVSAPLRRHGLETLQDE